MSTLRQTRSKANGSTSPSISDQDLVNLYRQMQRIRKFEEATLHLFEKGLVKGTAHSYIGEEAIATSVCANLRQDDYIGSYHRGHGHCIAKGADLGRMMAELMGNSEGYCGGLGGSMHIADISLGIFGANGIVGAAMPLCSGAALAAQLRENNQVAVAFFGDGASNQGVFHESMNLAAVWNLPLIFVCENNQYALTTPYHQTTSGPSIAARAAAYGMPSLRVDGNDPEVMFEAARTAITHARAGKGPYLVEALTYRWGQHSMRANLPDPRTDEEMQTWKARDPIALTAATLKQKGILTQEQINQIDRETQGEVDRAVQTGMNGTKPTLEQAMKAVYAPHIACAEPSEIGDRNISFVQAVNEAMDQAMAEDPNVILMGEDVGPTGGIFQTTKGLFDKYGPARVRDTPISEATFVGCGVGAALAGFRPIVEMQVFDFVTQSMDMIVNQAAKLRFMMGGHPTIPLVIRGPQGGGIRMAAQHSQSLETWFTHIPGLVVIGPSSPFDAKGLLISAIRDKNPVVFLENKLLYVSGTGIVPRDPYAIPIGKGKIKRPGRDVTIVATMTMVSRALAAAEQLASEGIEAEVIDPRTLHPLDEELILESVRKTNRLVIAHEACTRFGFGAEISALVTEKAFDWLDAPIQRVGAPFLPMPYADELERQVIPTQQQIAAAVRNCVQ